MLRPKHTVPISLEMAEKSDELKRLIREYPDYDIAFLVGPDACCDYCYMYASCIRFEIGELLDCAPPYDPDFERYGVCNDRDEFYENLEEWLWDELDRPSKRQMSDAEWDARVKAEVAKYDEFWRKAIIIIADN